MKADGPIAGFSSPSVNIYRMGFRFPTPVWTVSRPDLLNTGTTRSVPNILTDFEHANGICSNAPKTLNPTLNRSF